jgi:hypothetical protein
MKKQDGRTPEEIAADLERIEFAEIDEEDLQEVFGGRGGQGGSGSSSTIDPECPITNEFCPVGTL